MEHNIWRNFRYNGASDPKEFIKTFRLQAMMANWDDAKQAEIIPNMLIGKAERIFEEMSETDQKDIKKIIRELETKCAQSSEALLQAFQNRRQKDGESISEYALCLQDMLS